MSRRKDRHAKKTEAEKTVKHALRFPAQPQTWKVGSRVKWTSAVQAGLPCPEGVVVKMEGNLVTVRFDGRDQDDLIYQHHLRLQ